MKKGGESKISLCYPRGLGASPRQCFWEQGDVCSACGGVVDD